MGEKDKNGSDGKMRYSLFCLSVEIPQLEFQSYIGWKGILKMRFGTWIAL